LITRQFLFYAKGGWGTVRQHFSVTDTFDGFVFRSVNTNSSGADVGVGFEYMFIPNWTFWVEWDHIFLNHRSIDFVLDDRPRFTDNIHRDFDKVQFGIDWRFGGVNPPSRRGTEQSFTTSGPRCKRTQAVRAAQYSSLRRPDRITADELVTPTFGESASLAYCGH
jgi:hypothetical protein